jgi:hypothetical protein
MERKVTIYRDGARIRLHNKSVSFIETENNIMIKFLFADTNADIPACSHRCYKGKVRETVVNMTKEAFEALLFSYLEYKKH